MKILTISLLVFFSANTLDQEVQEIFEALQSGNVEQIGNFLDPRAEVHILENVSVYDRKSAIKALNAFFTKHKPSSYKRIHKGESKAQDSLYSIGSLETGDGNFRVYLYVKKVKDQIRIQELRIDED